MDDKEIIISAYTFRINNNGDLLFFGNDKQVHIAFACNIWCSVTTIIDEAVINVNN